jgi:hypothetical protein
MNEQGNAGQVIFFVANANAISRMPPSRSSQISKKREKKQKTK